MAEPQRVFHGIQRHDRVADITPTRLDWNLVVGVVRMYELPIPSNPNDFYQVDMILQDKEGDRILCSIQKVDFGLFKTLIREFGIYNMREFIVQPPGKGVRVSSHKYKLMFFRKTSVARLSMDAFPFSPFRVTPFPVVADMIAARQFHLIDCLGHVVRKEEVVDMVTQTGDATKRMAVYLEDLEGIKMKCTLFGGEMISQFNDFMARSNGEPVIMVAQLFKPNFYLNESSIQSTFHSSRIMFNPDFHEVKQFRERLLALGDIATQGIVDVPTQSQNSASSELAGGAIHIETIESVMNMHQEKHCWVLGDVVSINCGTKGWYYASCKNCYKKVEDKKDLYKCTNCHRLDSKPPLKYRLNVIIADGTGCLNMFFWNSEATSVLGMTAREMKDANPDIAGTSYPKVFESLLEKKFLLKISVEEKNITNVDQVYSVLKVSDDPAYIELYSAQRSTASGAEHSLSNGIVTLDSQDVEVDLGGSAIVSLSKDSTTESNSGDGLQTPNKDTPDACEEVGGAGVLQNPDANGSSNRPFHRGSGKRKTD